MVYNINYFTLAINLYALKVFMSALLIFGFIGIAYSQMPDSTLQKSKIRELKFLTGKWKGKGEISFKPGQSNSFTQFEDIQFSSGGTSLLIKGIGFSEAINDTVHNALAIVYFDEKKETYVINSHLEKGYHGSYNAWIEDGNFVWQIDGSNSPTIRYTINIKNGVWLEIGERKTNEGDWIKFFETNLNRI